MDSVRISGENSRLLKVCYAHARFSPCWESVTGQRSNQLNYVPTRQINEMRSNQCLCGFSSSQ